MTRPILPPEQVHPAIAGKIASQHADRVDEVRQAIARHRVVMVGMKQNPYPRKARRMLDQKGTPYHYLEYGSYFAEWRPRLALKMWSGWSTLPMIFVNGVLIGGADDLAKLMASGELDTMLSRPYPSAT